MAETSCACGQCCTMCMEFDLTPYAGGQEVGLPCGQGPKGTFHGHDWWSPLDSLVKIDLTLEQHLNPTFKALPRCTLLNWVSIYLPFYPRISLFICGQGHLNLNIPRALLADQLLSLLQTAEKLCRKLEILLCKWETMLCKQECCCNLWAVRSP